jgi:importin-7
MHGWGWGADGSFALAHRYRQNSDVLERVVNETFPQLVSIGTKLLASFDPSSPQSQSQSQSQDIPTILHAILKTYRGSIILQLSKHQQSNESLVPWGHLFFQVINLQIPVASSSSPTPNDVITVPQNEDEREKCEWWKAKKWAYSALGRLFHRYGNPSQLPSTMKAEYEAFAAHFVGSFAPEIFRTYLRQVELFVGGREWLSRKAQYHVFTFFTEW